MWRPRQSRCLDCGSRRVTRHAELNSLSIAHIDCDAFYASVEKRDNLKLADLPVIVGGGQRGVVAACCYVARLFGVRSAMPMFKALSLCPHAVVLPPDMKKYQAVGRQVRAMMLELTPLVQPLSIDEAFLDLTGTERSQGGSPARSLILLVRRLETEIGITASIGLSYNKFLAKVASDLDKPRGFKAIGRAEALDFLGPRPVGPDLGRGCRASAKAGAGRHQDHRRASRPRRGLADEALRRHGPPAVTVSPVARTCGRSIRMRKPRAFLRKRPSAGTYRTWANCKTGSGPYVRRCPAG